MTDKPTDLARQEDQRAIELGTRPAGDFIPNLMLAHDQSESVTSDIASPGEFVFANEDSLGPEVNLIIITYRFHAVLIEGGNKVLESYLSTSPQTKRIEQTPRKWPDRDPRYGLAWLCYLPDNGQYAIFHPNTGTARPASKTILAYYLKPETRKPADRDNPWTTQFKLTSYRKDLGKFKPWAPKITPVHPSDQSIIDGMDKDSLATVLNKFQEPVIAEQEAPPAEESGNQPQR